MNSIICDSAFIEKDKSIPVLPKKCGKTNTSFKYLCFEDSKSGNQIAVLPENQGPFKEISKTEVVRHLKSNGISDVMFVPLNVILEPKKFITTITRQMRSMGYMLHGAVLSQMSDIAQTYRSQIEDILAEWSELDPNHVKDLSKIS